MSEVNSEYKLTVGLEIHAELATKSKMWCGCKNDPDEVRPNVNICPVCMAHPGTLPVINKEAVRHVLLMGIAAGSKLAMDFTEFDRKNYFYPDIPKGYQLSQYKYPLVSGGEIHGVKLTRIHLEEDTGTSVHDKGDYSLVNFNRAGVPLMELVTEPVIHSAKEASEFAKELQLLLQYLGAGEANLEKGEMRVEANISISKTDTFGTKVEVKNLNSFKAVEKAIEYEVKRHTALLEKGEQIVQETRGWDENKGVTFSQRKKENAHDYRYFPDPDLPKLKLSLLEEFSEENLKKTLPELPWEKRKRFIEQYKLNPQHAEFFVSDVKASDYFDSITKILTEQKAKVELIQLASNYVAVDLAGLAKKPEFKGFPTADQIAGLVMLIDENKLSSRGAKDVLNLVALGDTNGAEAIAESNGWILKNDPEALKNTLKEVVAANAQVVADYKAGKTVALQFLVGQGMKATKGSAGPDTVKAALLELLG